MRRRLSERPYLHLLDPYTVGSEAGTTHRNIETAGESSCGTS
jgi:hypothetical protein